MPAATDKAVTQSYWLPREVVEWLAARGKRHDRSASWELTQILRREMEAEQDQPATNGDEAAA